MLVLTNACCVQQDASELVRQPGRQSGIIRYAARHVPIAASSIQLRETGAGLAAPSIQLGETGAGLAASSIQPRETGEGLARSLGLARILERTRSLPSLSLSLSHTHTHTCTHTLTLPVCLCRHFQLPRTLQTLIQVDGDCYGIHWCCVFRLSRRIPLYHTHLFQPIPGRLQRHNQPKHASGVAKLLVRAARRMCPVH